MVNAQSHVDNIPRELTSDYVSIMEDSPYKMVVSSMAAETTVYTATELGVSVQVPDTSMSSQADILT